MPRPSRFLTVWVVALLVLAGAVAGFNALVDPYDVFGRARIAGFNDIKPRARNHPMLTKTYQIERAKPATVLVVPSTWSTWRKNTARILFGSTRRL